MAVGGKAMQVSAGRAAVFANAVAGWRAHHHWQNEAVQGEEKNRLCGFMLKSRVYLHHGRYCVSLLYRMMGNRRWCSRVIDRFDFNKISIAPNVLINYEALPSATFKTVHRSKNCKYRGPYLRRVVRVCLLKILGLMNLRFSSRCSSRFYISSFVLREHFLWKFRKICLSENNEPSSFCRYTTRITIILLNSVKFENVAPVADLRWWPEGGHWPSI